VRQLIKDEVKVYFRPWCLQDMRMLTVCFAAVLFCVCLQARMRQLIQDEVKAYFRPELINRFDEQIVFHKLGLREVRKIADIMLADTKTRVATKGVTLAVGPRLLERIVRDGYSLEYGVRPLRQVGLLG
jgi:hypothetical protein